MKSINERARLIEIVEVDKNYIVYRDYEEVPFDFLLEVYKCAMKPAIEEATTKLHNEAIAEWNLVKTEMLVNGMMTYAVLYSEKYETLVACSLMRGNAHKKTITCHLSVRCIAAKTTQYVNLGELLEELCSGIDMSIDWADGVDFNELNSLTTTF